MTAADARSILCDILDEYRRDASTTETIDAILSAFPQIAPPSGNEAVEAARFIRELKKRAVLEEHDFPGDSPVVCGYTCFLCQRHAGDADDIPHAPDCPITMARSVLSLAPGKDVVSGAEEIAGLVHDDIKDADTMPDAIEAAKYHIARFAAEREARVREECAEIARKGCLVPPDGGSPTEDERQMCDAIAAAIRAGSGK